MEIGGLVVFHTTGRGATRLEAWSLDADGRMQKIQSLGLAAAWVNRADVDKVPGNDIFALLRVDLGGWTYLLAA